MNVAKKIWENRSQILEGVKNNIFKNKDIEIIAENRMKICISCPHLDKSGNDCLIPNTEPCCAKCGCSLKLKIRSLSSPCGDKDTPRWKALISAEEELMIKDKIGYNDPEN